MVASVGAQQQRDIEIVETDYCASTPMEEWSPANRLGHWYGASTEFVIKRLGDGNGRTCLVIGSPIAEALHLIDRGWDVTYLDIRRPPIVFDKFVCCDASRLNIADNTFDAVSSSCVLTHVGLGRYGDPLVENGDEKALAEIARILKPGCRATISPGGVTDAERTVQVGTAHRIYTISEIERMVRNAGLTIVERQVWSQVRKKWLDADDTLSVFPVFDYLSVLCEKKND